MYIGQLSYTRCWPTAKTTKKSKLNQIWSLYFKHIFFNKRFILSNFNYVCLEKKTHMQRRQPGCFWHLFGVDGFITCHNIDIKNYLEIKLEAHQVHSYCVLVFSKKNRKKGRRKLRLHRMDGITEKGEQWARVAKSKYHVCAFDVEFCGI